MKFFAWFWSFCLSITLSSSLYAAELPSSITLKISYEVGTGHDTLGRLVAARIQKYLPVGTTLAVENVPGASGSVLGRKISETEVNDGSIFALVPLGVVRNTIIDPKTSSMDAQKLQWIGGFSRPTMLCIGRKDTSTTDNYLQSASVKLATGAKGGIASPISNALKEMKFRNITIISGFKNELEIISSIDRKETDAMAGLTLQTYERLGLQDRMAIIGTITPSPAHQSAGIPYLFADITAEDRKALDILMFPAKAFYPFVLPPETPVAIVEAYRKAFSELSKDPEFLADLQKNYFEPTFISGADLQASVESLLKSDQAAIDRARELVK